MEGGLFQLRNSAGIGIKLFKPSELTGFIGLPRAY